jgi:UDP-glucuronate decarboxylase
LRGDDITLYGDGSQTRSFCYVDDMIEAMLRMMDTADDVTGPVNVGNPHEFSMRQLAELVMRLTGAKSKLIYQALPADDPKQRKPDITLARALLDGWEPTIALEAGLGRTIDYFRERLTR